MRAFDKDGIETNHCLIGLQCAAAYLYDTMYAETPSFTIETFGGDVSVKVEVGEKRKVKNVMVWENRNRVWTKGEVKYVCYGELEEMTFPRT
jgi:diaminopimelate epimerase